MSCFFLGPFWIFLKLFLFLLAYNYLGELCSYLGGVVSFGFHFETRRVVGVLLVLLMSVVSAVFMLW